MYHTQIASNVTIVHSLRFHCASQQCLLQFFSTLYMELNVPGGYIKAFDAELLPVSISITSTTLPPPPSSYLHQTCPEHNNVQLSQRSHTAASIAVRLLPTHPSAFPRHFTNTWGMSSSTTSSTITNLSMAAATAVSRSWDCACGPSCALVGDQNCAHQSGAEGRLMLPGFWLVTMAVLVCWFVLVGGSAASPPNQPQNDDTKASASTVTTALSAGNEDPSSTITYHPLAGRLLPEEVPIKRSEPKAKREIDTTTTANIPDKHPGATKIAILLAILLLSAMLVPMAFAEPTSTSAPSTSLTLPASSPCTTAFNATGTALSVEVPEKDKPQTWYWIPPNASDRTSINSVLGLVPLLLMGFFFLLPSLATGNLEKDIEIIDDVSIEGRSAPAETSPVWEIFFSTTTIWLPASTGTTTAPGRASSEPTEKPIGVATNGGGCAPSAEVEICTEANPAVCPIVLGRKPWKPV